MWNYYWIIIIIFTVFFILFIEQKNKVKRYWIFKNIERNEAIAMLVFIKQYLTRSVIIETISSKYYGQLEEVNDDYIVLLNGSHERNIIKIEFIVAVSILKVKEKRKKKDK